MDKILELEKYYWRCTGEFFPIAIYGDIPEEDDVIRAFHVVNVNNVSANEINVKSAPTENTLTDDEPELFKGEEGEEESKCERSIGFVKHITKITKRLIFESDPVPVTFHGRVNHITLKKYDVFINPRLSEVLCTTTFEALAMGKFVIIHIHPSNEFFIQFKNCLGFRHKTITRHHPPVYNVAYSCTTHSRASNVHMGRQMLTRVLDRLMLMLS